MLTVKVDTLPYIMPKFPEKLFKRLKLIYSRAEKYDMMLKISLKMKETGRAYA